MEHFLFAVTSLSMVVTEINPEGIHSVWLRDHVHTGTRVTYIHVLSHIYAVSLIKVALSVLDSLAGKYLM